MRLFGFIKKVIGIRLPYKKVGSYFLQTKWQYDLPEYVNGREVNDWEFVKGDLWKPIIYKRPLYRKGRDLYWKGIRVGDELFDERMRSNPRELRQYNFEVKRLNRKRRS